MKQAVLLLAHGAPDRLEDVEQYLGLVRSGRPLAPQVVHEVKRRYAALGGASPLLSWTRKQAEALEALLGRKVYFGMRNWKPFIPDTMEQIRSDGVERLVAICLAPQYSKMSIGLYFRRVQEAKQQLAMSTEIIWTKSFH
ncbi:MAG: ferrochelatase, partial [Acidobacteria bacterium]|nr:ferrochelatase [Acidobacteriota bacterium]